MNFKLTPLLFLFMTMPLTGFAQEKTQLPEKRSDVLQKLVQKVTAVEKLTHEISGVIPSKTFPRYEHEKQTLVECMGPTHEEWQKALKAGEKSTKDVDYTLEGECSPDDNSTVMPRAYNCFQLGKWYQGAFEQFNELYEWLNKSGVEVRVRVKNQISKYSDVLNEFIMTEIPAYCGQVIGPRQMNSGATFNQFLTGLKSFQATSKKVIKRLQQRLEEERALEEFEELE